MTWRAVLRRPSTAGAPHLSRPVTRRPSLPAALLLVAFAAACSEAPTAVPEAPDALAAKGGTPGPPSGGDEPTVEDTDPESAPQDTTLDVRVFGTKYDAGSTVELLLDGNSTNKVKTNSTTFVSDTELVANITIAADAEPDLYDVQVTTSKGKKGVGIEMFEITGQSWLLPASSGSDGPDGLYSDGGMFITDIGKALIVDCPRTFVLERPPEWSVASGTEIHCSTDGGGFSRLDNKERDAPGCYKNLYPEGCPIGTTGHDPDAGFGPDLNYYFQVEVQKGNGKAIDPHGGGTYNVVWVDARVTIDGVAPDGTDCRWHVWATEAEFWERTGGTDTIVKVDQNRPMALDVVIERHDVASCSNVG